VSIASTPIRRADSARGQPRVREALGGAGAQQHDLGRVRGDRLEVLGREVLEALDRPGLDRRLGLHQQRVIVSRALISSQPSP
jgi:hypothetical protein